MSHEGLIKTLERILLRARNGKITAMAAVILEENPQKIEEVLEIPEDLACLMLAHIELMKRDAMSAMPVWEYANDDCEGEDNGAS